MRRKHALVPSIAALTVAAACATAGLAQDRPRRGRPLTTRPSAPRVGEVAPPVKLKTLDGKREVDLAAYRDKRPVVLFFGSYT